MRMGRAIVGVFATLAMASAAQAAERLVLAPYPGAPWHEVINQTTGARFVLALVPEGQTLNDSQDILSAQSVPGYQGPPADFLARTFTQLGQNCDPLETVGPQAAQEQGRQVAYGRLYCGRQKGQSFGIHIFFKAILGSGALYVVHRDFRTPGSDHASVPTLPEDQAITFLEAEGAARKYLTDRVFVCDPVFPDPKCSTEAVPTAPPTR